MPRPAPLTLGRYTVRPLGPLVEGRCLWRLEWYPEGERGRMRTRGLGRLDAREAEDAAHRTIPTLDVARTRQSPPTAWGALLRLWLGHVEREAAAGLLRPRSVLAYTAAVQRVRYTWEAVALPESAAELRGQVEDLRAAELGLGLAAHTVQLDLAAAAMAWRWAVETDRVPAYPWPRVRVALPESAGYVPTPEDVARIVAWLETRTRAAHAWPAVAVQLWYAVGPRIGELAYLRVRDVDLTGRTITLGADDRASKTGARLVPLPSAVAERLAVYLRQRGGDGDARLWPGSPVSMVSLLSRRHVRPACRALGVPPFVLHSARTALADDLAARGVDPRTAADLLGHSPEVQLRRYRRPLLDSAREALETRGARVLSIRRRG